MALHILLIWNQEACISFFFFSTLLTLSSLKYFLQTGRGCVAPFEMKWSTLHSEVALLCTCVICHIGNDDALILWLCFGFHACFPSMAKSNVLGLQILKSSSNASKDWAQVLGSSCWSHLLERFVLIDTMEKKWKEKKKHYQSNVKIEQTVVFTISIHKIIY